MTSLSVGGEKTGGGAARSRYGLIGFGVRRGTASSVDDGWAGVEGGACDCVEEGGGAEAEGVSKAAGREDGLVVLWV